MALILLNVIYLNVFSINLIYGFSEDELLDLADYAKNNSALIWDYARNVVVLMPKALRDFLGMSFFFWSNEYSNSALEPIHIHIYINDIQVNMQQKYGLRLMVR